MSIKLLINKILHLFEIRRIKTKDNTVYLTFDDGPDKDITEFVLDQLNEYGFKATFFCKGENVAKNPQLVEKIKVEGHSLANHTYSHLHGFYTDVDEYIQDVNRATNLLNTNLFRPPFGALKLSQFIKLARNYKVVYWSVLSGDSDLERFDINKSMERLVKTQKGDVILFHFCSLHERETQVLLPKYLNWLKENKYISKAL